MMNNDQDDDFGDDDAERWEQHLEWVEATSRKHEALFGSGFRHTFSYPEEDVAPSPAEEEEECFRGRS